MAVTIQFVLDYERLTSLSLTAASSFRAGYISISGMPVYLMFDVIVDGAEWPMCFGASTSAVKSPLRVTPVSKLVVDIREVRLEYR